MRFIGDFHIHSHFSRATSKQLVPEMLDLWGQRKGLSVIGTGDFTHPGWTAELKEKLEPAEEGLFVLKKALRGDRGTVPSTRFLLTAEISSIYKYGGKVRKVHNLIFVPGFKTVERIQEKIEHLGGNIRSDGRPILGMDSRDLLELCLEADECIFFVPAHIWTPWFSALGSKSGFDSIEECYRDLTPYIRAVETGLSSDPPMNWACSFLDRYTIISNSDAHSPEKLGREACLFETDLSYQGIISALAKVGDGDRGTPGFIGTVEFFPQEGKYHHDGHRKCGISWNPLTTLENGGICPICGKPVTVGVLNRVASLADRGDITERPNRDPFYSLVPLKEILAEIEGVGSGSKRVAARYNDCLAALGPELEILLYRKTDEIRAAVGTEVAEAIQRMRMRHVEVEAGYDGEYGRIRVGRGNGFFSDTGGTGEQEHPLELLDVNLAAYRKFMVSGGLATAIPGMNEDKGRTAAAVALSPVGLNAQQLLAAEYTGGPSLIIAGPGTGKTRTVVAKIVHLLRSGVAPDTVLAVTFTNKAAGELRERLEAIDALVKRSSVPGKGVGIRVSTFHGVGLSILKDYLSLLGRREGFFIIDEVEKDDLLRKRFHPSGEKRKKILQLAFRVKSGLQPVPLPGTEEELYQLFRDYQDLLKENNCFDFDDLVYLPVRLFDARPDILDTYRQSLSHIIVDEYQDINPMQYTLLKAVSSEAEVCIVGDPNQSIYAFRGGSPEFIRHFPIDFPGTKVFALSRSYRCPDIILKASSQVLGETASLLSGLSEGVKISIIRQPTAAAEAEQIARDIENRLGGVGFFSFDSDVADSENLGEVSLSDIVILCRTSLQVSPLEKALKDHRIPFRTVSHGSLFLRDPYRSFLYFIQLIVSPESPLGVLFSDFAKIDRRQLHNISVPENLNEALTLYKTFFGSAEGMMDELKYFWPDDTGPEEFLLHARLGSDLERYNRRLEAVTIMTMHASKGLEFDLVYIPGCEDSIIPCTLVDESVKDEDDERRLLYVALTRAKREVVLSRAESRVIYGKKKQLPESPYLSLIEEELLRRREAEYHGDRGKHDSQLSLFD